MSNNQQQGQAQAVKPEQKSTDQVPQVWVVCRHPYTALLPSGQRSLSAAGSMPDRMPLRFERGLQLLVGHADLGNGASQFITLEQLPEKLRVLSDADRARELQRLMGEIRKHYPLCFTRDDIERNAPEVFKEQSTWPSGNAATFLAVGTMKELVRGYNQALRTGVSASTHRPSLLAALHHPDLEKDEDMKTLIRQRLTAWNQAD